MIINQNTWKYNTGMEISYDEYKAIHKFIEQFKGKEVIIADRHRIECTRVPFENAQVSFKSHEEDMRRIDIKRNVAYNDKIYTINLGLCSPRNEYERCYPSCEFEIKTSGQNSISSSLIWPTDNDLAYYVTEVFNEKKIISPEAAYSQRMYPNQSLQEFIENHEWNRIIEGIKQMPSLKNALFIIGNEKNQKNHFVANFGTILYQLITYRKEHVHEMSREELFELDKALSELSRSELLKVSLVDDASVSKTYPSKSILLDCHLHSTQARISEQYNVENGELVEEKEILIKTLKKLKNR